MKQGVIVAACKREWKRISKSAVSGQRVFYSEPVFTQHHSAHVHHFSSRQMHFWWYNKYGAQIQPPLSLLVSLCTSTSGYFFFILINQICFSSHLCGLTSLFWVNIKFHFSPSNFVFCFYTLMHKMKPYTFWLWLKRCWENYLPQITLCQANIWGNANNYAPRKVPTASWQWGKDSVISKSIYGTALLVWHFPLCHLIHPLLRRAHENTNVNMSIVCDLLCIIEAVGGSVATPLQEQRSSTSLEVITPLWR